MVCACATETDATKSKSSKKAGLFLRPRSCRMRPRQGFSCAASSLGSGWISDSPRPSWKRLLMCDTLWSRVDDQRQVSSGCSENRTTCQCRGSCDGPRRCSSKQVAAGWEIRGPEGSLKDAGPIELGDAE